MEPMFDSRPDLLGLPGGVIVFTLAVALLLAGAGVALRMTAGEPEARTFRATDRGRSRLASGSAIALAVGAAVLLLLYAGVLRQSV